MKLIDSSCACACRRFCLSQRLTRSLCVLCVNAQSPEHLQEALTGKQGARLDDVLLAKVVRHYLTTVPKCRNAGYVLDGFPKTIEQAQILFAGTSFLPFCCSLMITCA